MIGSPPVFDLREARARSFRPEPRGAPRGGNGVEHILLRAEEWASSGAGCTGLMGPELRLSIVVDEAAAVLVLGGELDLATVGQLERAVQTVTASSAPRVIVDMSGVAFCDVTNLRLLVATAARLEGQGRQLILRHPRRFFLRLLDLADTRGHVTVDSSPGNGDSDVSIAGGG